MSTGVKITPYLLEQSKGKYIALCEGDDYWSDATKLKTQIDFLEKNKDYVLVGNDARINQNSLETDILVKNIGTQYIDITTKNLLIKNYFVTGMTCFKNMDFKADFLNKKFQYSNVGDWPLFTYMSLFGKCRFFSKPVGYYRLHSGGLTNKNRIEYNLFKNEYINRINHAEFWNNHCNGKYLTEFVEEKKKRSKSLVNYAIRNQDLKTALLFSKNFDLRDLNKMSSKITWMALRLVNKFYSL